MHARGQQPCCFRRCPGCAVPGPVWFDGRSRAMMHARASVYFCPSPHRFILRASIEVMMVPCLVHASRARLSRRFCRCEPLRPPPPLVVAREVAVTWAVVRACRCARWDLVRGGWLVLEHGRRIRLAEIGRQPFHTLWVWDVCGRGNLCGAATGFRLR